MLREALRVAAIAGLGLVLVATPVLGADSDGDGLKDGFEQKWGVTDYLDPDSDNDGVVDSAEDLDKDRLGNLGEQRSGTDPSKWDTDGDGRPDGKDVDDNNGLTNAREQDRRPVPPGLVPALRDAADDRQPARKRCQAGHRVTKVESCTFGDRRSDTTIALLGDSHMTMYLTAYRQLANARGWKIVTMTKAACPAFLGMHGGLQYKIDKDKTCRIWRRNVIDKLKADPPDYIVFGHANYRLKTLTGKDIPTAQLPQVWRQAAARTLKQLPASTEVLLLGLVPRNKTNPVACLRRYPQNISKCVARAVPTVRRRIDNALRRAARNNGAMYATLHDKICTYDPCPVVQGRVLMWRDGGHLSETFARKLRPAIASMIDHTFFGAAS